MTRISRRSIDRILLALAFLAVVLPVAQATVRAEGDIVYSARYYAPPGSRYCTHFHIYTICPDGTGRRQITLGDHDDYSPSWTRGGRKIQFIRKFGSSGKLIVCDENGRNLQLVDVLPPADVWLDGQNPYGPPTDTSLMVGSNSSVGADSNEDSDIVSISSPDGKHAYGATSQLSFVGRLDRKGKIVDRKPVKGIDHGGVAWLDNVSFAAITSAVNATVLKVKVYTFSGEVSRQVSCRWPDTSASPYGPDFIDEDEYLAPSPTDHATCIYVKDTGNSENRPCNDYYLCNTMSGVMTRICQGQYLAWRPDSHDYCSATEHELAQYDKSRSVYTSQLFVGRTGSTKDHIIVSGMVWVTDADWRKSPHG